MSHPIVQRELLGTLRRKRALALLVGAAVAFSFLVISRWPSDATVELSGAQAREVFRLFSYGLLTVVLLLVPAFPATSVVKEKTQGTLTLLLNSPLSALSIFWGKLLGSFGFVALLLALSVPAAMAAYAMGGISLLGDVVPLYGILLLVLLQYTALALMVSSYANSLDAALRITYALVLLLAVLSLAPNFLLQGQDSFYARLAEQIRFVSPIPAIMEVAGQGGTASLGGTSFSGALLKFVCVSLGLTGIFSVFTVSRFRSYLLDRPRPPGVMTEERSAAGRLIRRLVFLVDPRRRKRGIAPLVNPVMVKEFRTRRFGRSHWLLRLVAVSALASLYLTYAATTGTIDWGVETIGAWMVLLQVALIVVIAPSLAANLISVERESGGWELLMTTPVSPASVLIGKLGSALITLALVLLATVPGYLVMIWIHPPLRWEVWQVLICLGWMALFSLLLSAAISSLCRRTATATAIAYALLAILSVGTLLFWLGRDTTFGHGVVEAALTINSAAAALQIIQASDFGRYDLVPANWWWMASLCGVCLLVLVAQTWRLTRPR